MQKNRLYSNLLELCSVPSISETKGELEIADKIYQLLKQIHYFNRNPELVKMCPVCQRDRSLDHKKKLE